LDLPVDRAFALHADGARIAEWFPGAHAVEGLTGPLDRTGTTYALRFNRLFRSRVTVTGTHPPHLHERTWKTRPLGTRGRAVVELHPERGGTRMVLDVDYGLPLGPLGWIAGHVPMIRRRVRNDIDRELESFKEWAQRQPG
jgi:hypothetical protein